MTDARLEQVHADRVSAREFLEQAVQFLADAGIDGLTAPSRAVLLHNAVISACDAILQAICLRVTPGDRSHVLRLETALQELDADTEELFERLDASRERRNEASSPPASSPRPARGGSGFSRGVRCAKAARPRPMLDRPLLASPLTPGHCV